MWSYVAASVPVGLSVCLPAAAAAVADQKYGIERNTCLMDYWRNPLDPSGLTRRRFSQVHTTTGLVFVAAQSNNYLITLLFLFSVDSYTMLPLAAAAAILFFFAKSVSTLVSSGKHSV